MAEEPTTKDWAYYLGFLLTWVLFISWTWFMTWLIFRTIVWWVRFLT